VTTGEPLGSLVIDERVFPVIGDDDTTHLEP
jgi:hypothetical protein